MIPTTNTMLNAIEDIVYPTKTHRIEINSNRINGFTDDLDAVIQAIYLILNTERYEFVIYSWGYGIELLDLYGKPMPYVISELQRRITEALTRDNRITSVNNFKFDVSGKTVHVTFDVVTEYGTVQAEKTIKV